MSVPTRHKKEGLLWRLDLGQCVIECYDFQLLKISNPPEHNADPVTLDFPIKKTP